MSLKTEKRAESIAEWMCRERKLPPGMRELLLNDAYNLIYFGNESELARIERAIAKAKSKKRKS